ncbi:hypothetical protein ATANTOWER_015230 [Ataeniobius toweri]|uniref:Uncharacterized protein n=1 Tax=Ataeniobius toweri TaxID=208326 RepID=A0ABU7B9R4_9TELE|nr:hypothetical protein [Ataeniobius toweri]
MVGNLGLSALPRGISTFVRKTLESKETTFPTVPQPPNGWVTGELVPISSSLQTRAGLKRDHTVPEQSSLQVIPTILLCFKVKLWAQ